MSLNHLPVTFSPALRADSIKRCVVRGAAPHLEQHLRVLFYENYAVYYVPRADEIIIVRVLHASRDIVSVADEGGFAIWFSTHHSRLIDCILPDGVDGLRCAVAGR
jgi:hypothetical protein